MPQRIWWIVATLIIAVLILTGAWTFMVHLSAEHHHHVTHERARQHTRFTTTPYTRDDHNELGGDNDLDDQHHHHHQVDPLYDACMNDSAPTLGYELSRIEEACRPSVMKRYCNRRAGRVSPLETATASSIHHMWDTELNARYASYVPSPSHIDVDQLRLAYILLTHGEPKQLFRLLAAIYNEHDLYYIHVDGNTDVTHIATLTHSYWSTLSNIHIVVKHRVLWGGAGLMWATIDGIRSLIHTDQSLLHQQTINNNNGNNSKTRSPWHFVINLSQSDYPLASSGELRQVLASRLGFNFMNINMETDRHLNDGYNEFVECGNHMYRVGDTPRVTAISMERGAQWWILSRAFAEWFDQSQMIAALAELMAHTPMPDERLWQTALVASPLARYGISLNYHWQLPREAGTPKCDQDRAATFIGVYWCGTGPRWITSNDLPLLVGPPHAPLFVRKMHPVISAATLDTVDERRVTPLLIWTQVDTNHIEMTRGHIWQWMAIAALKRSLTYSTDHHNNNNRNDDDDNDSDIISSYDITVDSVHVLQQSHVVAFAAQAYDRTYRVHATLKHHHSDTKIILQWCMRAHLGGWVAGRLLRNDIGTRHDESILTINGRIWIMLANHTFVAQQWWLPSIQPWQMWLDIIPATIVPPSSSSLPSDSLDSHVCHSVVNATSVATMTITVASNWRYTWTRLRVAQPGVYMVRITQMATRTSPMIIGIQCMIVVSNDSIISLQQSLPLSLLYRLWDIHQVHSS